MKNEIVNTTLEMARETGWIATIQTDDEDENDRGNRYE